MSESDTSLSFLMNRDRPKVSPRDDALFASDRGNIDLQENKDEMSSSEAKVNLISALDRRSIEQELSSIPSTKGIHLKVQAKPIHDLQDHLSAIDTTREVWIESAIAVALAHPDFCHLIDQEAIGRYSLRKNWKKRKQALTRLLNTM